MAELNTEIKAGQKDGRATGSGSMGSRGGIQSRSLQGDKKWGRVQEIGGIWGRNPAGCRNPVDQAMSLHDSVGGQGSEE